MSPNPLAVRCPTCGAKPHAPCKNGDKPSRPHDRRFSAIGYDRSIVAALSRSKSQLPTKGTTE